MRQFCKEIYDKGTDLDTKILCNSEQDQALLFETQKYLIKTSIET